MTSGERLYKAMIKNGFTKNSLAVKCGCHPTTINNWINNITKPDNLKLDIVSRILNVNKEWILTGIGEMEIDKELKKFIISDENREVNEPVVEKIDCLECINKKKIIDDLTAKYIKLLEEKNVLNKKYQDLIDSKVEIKKETTDESHAPAV